MPRPRTVILCGNNRTVAATASDMIQPEYESIYSSYSINDALSELPRIVAGAPPVCSSLQTSFVTADYPPSNANDIVAIVLGAGYDDAAATALHAACVEACAAVGHVHHVPFVREDRKLTAMLSEGEEEGFDKNQSRNALVRRLKDRLRALEEGWEPRSAFIWY